MRWRDGSGRRIVRRLRSNEGGLSAEASGDGCRRAFGRRRDGFAATEEAQAHGLVELLLGRRIVTEYQHVARRECGHRRDPMHGLIAVEESEGARLDVEFLQLLALAGERVIDDRRQVLAMAHVGGVTMPSLGSKCHPSSSPGESSVTMHDAIGSALR